MSRAATRCTAVRFVVLAAACMMALSIVGPAGHVLYQSGAGKALSVHALPQGIHPEETGEEETDSHGAGSFTLCMEALGESFAPEFLPPSDEGKVLLPAMRFQRSAYLPRIYRPPIS